MKRLSLAMMLVLAGCNEERDTPVPPPPPTSATTAPATTPPPATTTTTATPTTTATATPTTTATATPTATATATPTATPTPPATPPTAEPSAICQSAFRCCEAAVAAMPIGGLVAGCGELRNADASRADYCREAITTYRATLTQIGAPIPAACHAPH